MLERRSDELNSAELRVRELQVGGGQWGTPCSWDAGKGLRVHPIKALCPLILTLDATIPPCFLLPRGALRSAWSSRCGRWRPARRSCAQWR